jgi:hypothetical protein
MAKTYILITRFDCESVQPARRPDHEQVLQEVLAANEKYVASFGDKGKLPLPPARQFAILTCMDARLHPSKCAGLAD